MQPGRLTLLTAACAWVSAATAALIQPASMMRYAAVAMLTAGKSGLTGAQVICHEFRDVAESKDYVLSGDSGGSPVRGVPLRHMAGLAGAQPPRWRGSFASFDSMLSRYLTDKQRANAIKSVQDLFGEEKPDCAFIPFDGDLQIGLEALLTSDLPATISLLAIDLGEASDGFGANEPEPFGQPYWFPHTPVALAASTVISPTTVQERLTVPKSRHGGAAGLLFPRVQAASLFAQSGGALAGDAAVDVTLATTTEDGGGSRFVPDMAPVQLAAALPLPLYEGRGRSDGDQVSFNYATASLSAAQHLFVSRQYEARKLGG